MSKLFNQLLLSSEEEILFIIIEMCINLSPLSYPLKSLYKKIVNTKLAKLNYAIVEHVVCPSVCLSVPDLSLWILSWCDRCVRWQIFCGVKLQPSIPWVSTLALWKKKYLVWLVSLERTFISVACTGFCQGCVFLTGMKKGG